MNQRRLFATVLVAAFLAPSLSGAAFPQALAGARSRGAIDKVATASGAAFPGAVAGAPGGAAQATAEVIVPGGMRFVRNAAGLRRAGDDDRDRFLAELTAYLSAPLVLDYAERVRLMVDELRALQDFVERLDDEYPGVVASLAEANTPGYAKATALLDFLGFRIADDTDRIQLLRQVGDREARRRQMLGYLGVSVPVQSRLWAAGEPVIVPIENERVPLLFGAEVWNAEVFEDTLGGEALFDAFIANPRARGLMAGLAALDSPTQQWIADAVGLRSLYDDGDVVDGFMRLAPYLRAADGDLLLPGGDADAWREILGPWSDSAELLERLATRDGGRAAHLWRALSLIPERRARYLLTMNHADAAARAAWAGELYDAIRTPDFGDSIRWPEDVAELFVNLRLLPDDAGIAWPGGGEVWRAAMADDDRLETPAALDALWAGIGANPATGPAVDQPLLRRMLRDSEPDRDEPSVIRKFNAISQAIRYQPIDAMRRALPLLYRNYRAFGRAYGFFVMPAPLPAGTAERLVWHLQQVDAIEPNAVRIDAIRQVQASTMLLRQVLLNDLLTSDDRAALVDGFLALPVPSAASAVGAASYGNAVTEWWRTALVPAMARGLQANGWPGDPEDLRSVVVTALVGRIGIAELEVDGIDYNYTPANLHGRRMHTHLLLQQQPPFEKLFLLDDIAVGLGRAAPSAADADAIEVIVDELRTLVPPNIGDEEVTEALPVAISRNALFVRSQRLVAEMRGGAAFASTVASFRQAVNAYLGDALVGMVYALSMGDPQSFTYQQGHIAWLHRLIIAELGDDGPSDLFSPWATTAESWILDEGSRLHNSLYGAPGILARWNLEDIMPSGGSRDPAAAETWAATLAHIHLPSLVPQAQAIVARRHALATSWIDAAIAARDADVSPAFWPGVDRTVEAPRLAATLRPLLRAPALQRFEDAVREGRAADAHRLVSDGNRYLMLLSLDDYDADVPAAARWLVDQMVGMPSARRGDYSGLTTPSPVPYGEAGDEFADPLIYSRLFDVRVRLAVLMEEQGLPASLHGRLLMGSMAQVLSTMTPATFQPWSNLMVAIEAAVTEAAVSQLVVDLAFADELTPSDPNVALSALASGDDRGGAPAGRATTLGLPVDMNQYQAAFDAEVDIVTVDIGVWDDDERFVTDLSLNDIVVLRDGVPVNPTFLRLEGNAESTIFLDDLPAGVEEKVVARDRNFVMVADMLTTSPQDWERILLDVTEFVRAGIAVNDRLALVTIDSRGVPSVTHDFTLDHERIAEILEAQVGNSFATADRETSFNDLSTILCDNGACTVPPGDAVADGGSCDAIATPRFYQCVTGAPEWEDQKFRIAQGQLGRWSIEARLGAERVMAAMTQVGSMLALGDPYDRQKNIILLSSGFERQPASIHHQIIMEYASYSTSLNPMEVRALSSDLSVNITALSDALKRCRCTIYSLGTLGNSAFMTTSAQQATQPLVSRFSARTALQAPLNALARDTGGRPFFGSDMSVGFREVLEDTRLRYVLGFTMDGADSDVEPTWRNIEVTILRADVDEVRARDGFMWPRR